MNDVRPKNGAMMRPAVDEIPRWTDHYFLRSKAVVERFGDKTVTYAVFMRRPVIATTKLAVDWLNTVAASRNTRFAIELRYSEGAWVGAGEPLMYIAGSLRHFAPRPVPAGGAAPAAVRPGPGRPAAPHRRPRPRP